MVRAEDEAMNLILGTQGGIQGGSGRQINSQLGRAGLMGHRRALWWLVTLNWGFLEWYLELMTFEVILQRGKEFSEGKQD